MTHRLVLEVYTDANTYSHDLFIEYDTDAETCRVRGLYGSDLSDPNKGANQSKEDRIKYLGVEDVLKLQSTSELGVMHVIIVGDNYHKLLHFLATSALISK